MAKSRLTFGARRLDDLHFRERSPLLGREWLGKDWREPGLARDIWNFRIGLRGRFR